MLKREALNSLNYYMQRQIVKLQSWHERLEMESWSFPLRRAFLCLNTFVQVLVVGGWLGVGHGACGDHLPTFYNNTEQLSFPSSANILMIGDVIIRGLTWLST